MRPHTSADLIGGRFHPLKIFRDDLDTLLRETNDVARIVHRISGWKM